MSISSATFLLSSPTAVSSGNMAPEGNPFFFGFALEGDPITKDQLKGVEQQTGIRPGIVVFFIQWPAPSSIGSGRFPSVTLENIWDAGAVPCITWEPMYYEGDKEVTIPYNDILSGTYDPYIRQFAQRARSWGKPVMIRFAHEMNIQRYHWGTDEKEYGPQSPVIYRKMHRYVVSLFKAEGATNVLWAFCPNSESVPNTSYDKRAGWNTIQDYYPGNDYIDILGMDGYNWGTTQKKESHGWESRWVSFDEIFHSTYKGLRRLAPEKPIFVFETSSVSRGGDKKGWIDDAMKTARQWKLHGIIWFHVHKEMDWRLQCNIGIPGEAVTGAKPSQSQSWAMELIK